MNRFAAALPLILVASCQPALADASGALWSWSDLVREVILMTASAVVTAAVAIGVAQFTKWTGIQVEAKQREAIHGAAMTGVNLALAKYGPAIGLSSNGRVQVVRDAMDWVLSAGAPDAVSGLKLSDDEVRKVVESKLGAMTNASATVAVTAGSVPVGG